MLSSKLAKPMVGAIVACAVTIGFEWRRFRGRRANAGAEGSNAHHAAADAAAAAADRLTVAEAAAQQQQAGPAGERRDGPRARPKGKETLSPLENEVRQFPEGLLRRARFVGGLHHQGHLRPRRLPLRLRHRRARQPVCASRPRRRQRPTGKVGWLGAMSSNGSSIGYRGSHQDPQLGRGLHLPGVDLHRHGGGARSAGHLDQVLEHGAGRDRSRRHVPRLSRATPGAR